MSFTKRIVCLANSRKLGARCVAGKEILADGFGEWIRPISATETGELDLAQIQCQDGQPPRLLDVIQIPLERHQPHSFQTENYVVDEMGAWIREHSLDQRQLPRLLDNVASLWSNGHDSFSGINDRIPVTLAEQRIKTSLRLVKPERLALRVAPELHSRKVRADFEYRHSKYLLMVTDPLVENVMLQRADGIYPISASNIYLCVSLGEPFQGYTYKLVASVINFPFSEP